MFVCQCLANLLTRSQSEKLLSSLPKFDCFTCLPDIGRHYDESLSITLKSQAMLNIALGNPQGSKILSAGRVVILRDGVCVSRSL